MEPIQWKIWLEQKQYELLFNDIVDKFTEPLYWQARKIVTRHDLADDVLQDSFINIWKALPKFKGDSSFYTWLYRIVTNQSIALLKKEKRFSEYHPENYKSLSEDPFFNGDETLIKLYQEIAKLPVKQQVVFKLRYLEEKPYHEISALLETSEGALKASYHHAKEKIKKSFNLD